MIFPFTKSRGGCGCARRSKWLVVPLALVALTARAGEKPSHSDDPALWPNTVSRANVLGVFKDDSFGRDKLLESVGIVPWVAIHAGKFGELVPFGLADIEHMRCSKPEQAGLRVFG